MTSLKKVEELMESNKGMANALRSRIERLENEILQTADAANENMNLRNRNRELIKENTGMREENERERENNKELSEKCSDAIEYLRQRN